MLGEPELTRVLVPQRVLILDSKTKRDALLELTDCLGSAAEVKDRDALVQAIFYREELMSTGIGMGIGVPHVRLASVTRPVMSAGLCRNPITDGPLSTAPKWLHVVEESNRPHEGGPYRVEPAFPIWTRTHGHRGPSQVIIRPSCGGGKNVLAGQGRGSTGSP